MSELRRYLANAYGSQADRRCKNPDVDRPITIDDKGPHDVHPYFCSMTIRVANSGDDTLILSIQHVPLTPEVRSLIEDQGGTIREIPSVHTAEIPLKTKSVPFIRQLAKSIRSAVGRGKRYDDPNWKWLCPRTAASLERLARVVKAYNSERRSTEKWTRSSHAASTKKS
jgi:hypothetical protein